MKKIAYLYHGSNYKHSVLRPGIHYSKVRTEWDQTESNEYLYASIYREEAISQGFASGLEKRYSLVRYSEHGNTLDLYISGDLPEITEIKELDVYLYTLVYDEDVWVKVGNKHNGSDSEYKTKKKVPESDIESVEKINLDDWLDGKNVNIKQVKKPAKW